MPHRDDIHSAYGKISRLEQENLDLEQQLLKRGKDKKVKCEECGGGFHRMGSALFGVVLALGLLGALLALPYNGLVNNQDTHCYVENYERDGAHRVDLKRNVEWGSDYLIGRYSDVDTALLDASKIKCVVK
jgi:hypothetical protein